MSDPERQVSPSGDDEPEVGAEVPFALRFVIQGHVQGVGYRYFVAREAQRLCVAGWVRNCPDGSVEVIGMARPSVLEEFVAQLEHGAHSARIERIQHQQTAVDMHMLRGHFEIRG